MLGYRLKRVGESLSAKQTEKNEKNEKQREKTTYFNRHIVQRNRRDTSRIARLLGSRGSGCGPTVLVVVRRFGGDHELFREIGVVEAPFTITICNNVYGRWPASLRKRRVTELRVWHQPRRPRPSPIAAGTVQRVVVRAMSALEMIARCGCAGSCCACYGRVGGCRA